ncbi:hypothetical protein GOP47_0023185 [Adiantum capillus-veneris]|uniref:Uncharacterized protein n=1 Tax=Adiantum capillus-veneris TaxID=13818 RepID=A0A9D4U6W4_ADICA|nr:hypothetical protein GOP47_0023185 [Adiantum capillus-veneris]
MVEQLLFKGDQQGCTEKPQHIPHATIACQLKIDGGFPWISHIKGHVLVQVDGDEAGKEAHNGGFNGAPTHFQGDRNLGYERPKQKKEDQGCRVPEELDFVAYQAHGRGVHEGERERWG